MPITVPVVDTEIGVAAFGAPVANGLNALQPSRAYGALWAAGNITVPSGSSDHLSVTWSFSTAQFDGVVVWISISIPASQAAFAADIMIADGSNVAHGNVGLSATTYSASTAALVPLAGSGVTKVRINCWSGTGFTVYGNKSSFLAMPVRKLTNGTVPAFP